MQAHAPAEAPALTADVRMLQLALAAPAWPPGRWRRLAQAARLVRCPAGPLMLASPRRPEPSWWLVRQGQVAVGRRQADGRFLESRRLGPGQWLDVAGALTPPGTWLDDAECTEPCELLAVPVHALWQAYGHGPQDAQALAEMLAGRLRERSLPPPQA